MFERFEGMEDRFEEMLDVQLLHDRKNIGLLILGFLTWLLIADILLATGLAQKPLLTKLLIYSPLVVSAIYLFRWYSPSTKSEGRHFFFGAGTVLTCWYIVFLGIVLGELGLPYKGPYYYTLRVGNAIPIVAFIICVVCLFVREIYCGRKELARNGVSSWGARQDGFCRLAWRVWALIAVLVGVFGPKLVGDIDYLQTGVYLLTGLSVLGAILNLLFISPEAAYDVKAAQRW